VDSVPRRTLHSRGACGPAQIRPDGGPGAAVGLAKGGGARRLVSCLTRADADPGGRGAPPGAQGWRANAQQPAAGPASRWEASKAWATARWPAAGIGKGCARPRCTRPLAFCSTARPARSVPRQSSHGCSPRPLLPHSLRARAPLPEGPKGGASPCQVRFFGRRGKPVKKMRLVPADKAFAIARKLQGSKGSTFSVI
jgi:hypothetical protein